MLEKYKQKYPREGHEFMTFLQGGLPSKWESVLPKFSQSDPIDATRGYSEKCLNQIANVIPGLIGGSSDLASSNKVYLKEFEDFKQPESPWGRNIHYSVREHAMDGISNGIALHGCVLIPLVARL